MKHLIDKDVVVAEIEKFEKALKNACKPDPFGNVKECMTAAELQALDVVKKTINDLEVKEVDLEEELESFAYTLPHSAIGDGEHLGKFDDPKVKEARKNGWSHLWRYNYVKEIAKHFF